MPAPPQVHTRVQRRAEVARLALDGLSQAEIAAALRVNQATVSRDLRHVRRQRRTAAARALWQADEAALARVDRIEVRLWEVWDRSKEGLFETRTRYHPRTGRRTEIDTLTGLPGGEPRCFHWMIECARLRLAIMDRMTGKRHREPYVLHNRMMRIVDALKSLQRKYPDEGQAFQPVGQVSQPAESVTASVSEPVAVGAPILDGGLFTEECQGPAPRPPLAKGGSALAESLSEEGARRADERLTTDVAGSETCPTMADSLSTAGGAPKTSNPDAHLCSGGLASSPTSACQTNVCGAFGAKSIFVRSPGCSNRGSVSLAGSRGTTKSGDRLKWKVGGRSTGGLTPRRSPRASKSRTDARIYAATVASRHGQGHGRQTFAMNSPARTFSSRRPPMAITDRCSRPLPEIRCRGPPTAGKVPPPLSAVGSPLLPPGSRLSTGLARSSSACRTKDRRGQRKAF